MIAPFTYEQLPGRVVFGVGTLDRLPDEVGRLGAQRAIVLSTPEQADVGQDVARRLGPRNAGVFAQAMMHVPIETARAAREDALRAPSTRPERGKAEIPCRARAEKIADFNFQ